MIDEYRIDAKEFLRTMNQRGAFAMLVKTIDEFAESHGIDYRLTLDDYLDVYEKIQGKDAVVFSILHTLGKYDWRLEIILIDGDKRETYCIYNGDGRTSQKAFISTMKPA